MRKIIYKKFFKLKNENLEVKKKFFYFSLKKYLTKVFKGANIKPS